MKKKRTYIKKIICLGFGLLLLFRPTFVSGEELTETSAEPDSLYALSACLMDAETGRILFAKDCDKRMANASTTKVMTLIVTLENSDLTETVKVSSYAASQPEVKLHMQEEEEFLLKDLCYSLMLESHNDTAVAIAEHVGGSVEGFTAMMNQKAKEIGCRDTNFITPNGLDAENENGIHGTTAAELAQILRYCITDSPKKEEFLEITGTPSYSFSNVDGSRSFQCSNHNAFLTMMEGALTGKTGFTGNAGYCYVGALTSGDSTYIAALLACGWPNNRSYKWSDMRKLMEYAVNNYHRADIAEGLAEIEEIPVENAGNEKYSLSAPFYTKVQYDRGALIYPVKESDTVEILYDCRESLTAPVEKGSTVGHVTILLNGEAVEKRPVCVAEEIPGRNQTWYFYMLLEKILL